MNDTKETFNADILLLLAAILGATLGVVFSQAVLEKESQPLVDKPTASVAFEREPILQYMRDRERTELRARSLEQKVVRADSRTFGLVDEERSLLVRPIGQLREECSVQHSCQRRICRPRSDVCFPRIQKLQRRASFGIRL